MKAGIYKITNPNGKVYIGQSKDIKSRINRYKKLQCCKNQLLLYRSFIKYGVDSHIFEEVEVGDFNKKELNLLESNYILEFKSFNKYNKNGLNLTSGGDSVELTDSTRKKMSDTRKRLFKEGQRNSKLTFKDVENIKKQLAFNVKLKDISKLYNVSSTNISQIKNNHTWKDVPDYIVPKDELHLIIRTNQYSRLQKLTEIQRQEILDLIFKGDLLYKEIAEIYNVTKGAISAIKRSYIKFKK